MNILTTFSFENKTYEYILKSFEEQTIFGLLLDNYFSQELKSNTVLLDDEQVSL